MTDTNSSPLPAATTQSASALVRPQQFRAKFEERLDYNTRFAKFSFELIEPHRLDFTAGQYVSIQINERGERRSYSICSEPNVKHGFETLVDLKPNGIGGQYLKSLKFGDDVNLLAPMGRFFIPENLTAPAIVLVATGSGISPFRSIILDLLQTKQTTRTVELIWGMRQVEELFWLDDFQDLVDAFPNFYFHPVISQPVDNWPLCRGRVTDCLQTHQLRDQATYFLCGNAGMIQDVKTLLTEMKIPATNVYTEEFY